jgi:hypothetical protein
MAVQPILGDFLWHQTKMPSHSGPPVGERGDNSPAGIK